MVRNFLFVTVLLLFVFVHVSILSVTVSRVPMTTDMVETFFNFQSPAYLNLFLSGLPYMRIAYRVYEIKIAYLLTHKFTVLTSSVNF